jgi:anti-sigma regulatory factor (Ser/Thr protein kinase)
MAHNKSAHITVRPWPEAHAPAEARNAVRRFCEDHGFDEHCEAAVLLTSEVVTNAIRHTAEILTVVVRCEGDTLTVAVRDGSTGELHVDDRGLLGESGRGLMILGALSEEWGVRQHPRGKSVWFRLERTT